MGKISPQTTSQHLDLDGIEAHYGALDGYTVGFEFSAHDQDPASVFSGLPDNACQARLGRGHGCHLGPRPSRPHLHAPHRRAAWSAVQTLGRPHDRVSIRKASPSRPRRSNSRSPAAEVRANGRADLPAHVRCARPRCDPVGRRHPRIERPPRPLLVAGRMSTTLNNPPNGPSR